MRFTSSRAAATLLLLLPIFAHADLIDITTGIGFSGATGNGGFESCSGCPDVEAGTLSFTYDTSVADSDPLLGQGLFVDAISAFHMEVEQQTRPDLSFSFIEGSVRSLNVNGSLFVSMTILATEANNPGTYSFSFNMHDGGALWQFTDVPVPLQFWSPGPPVASPSGGCGPIPDPQLYQCANETDWIGAGWTASVRPVTPVPEPETYAMWLLGVAAVWFSAFRRRGECGGASLV